MSAHAKFLFDTEFGDIAEDALPPAPTFSVEELEAVRASAHADGIEAGRTQAIEEFMAGASTRIDKLERQADQAVVELQAQREKLVAEAIEVAMVSADMLAQTLIAREPNAILLALFEECISHVSAAPHIVVRVSGGELEHLRDELKSRAELLGCNGRIVILVEDDMQPGDCRIEWADGGVSRDGAQLRQTLRRLIESRYPAGWSGQIPDDKKLPDGDVTAATDAPANSAAEEHDHE